MIFKNEIGWEKEGGREEEEQKEEGRRRRRKRAAVQHGKVNYKGERLRVKEKESHLGSCWERAPCPGSLPPKQFACDLKSVFSASTSQWNSLTHISSHR